jgi:hypothetical protein
MYKTGKTQQTSTIVDGSQLTVEERFWGVRLQRRTGDGLADAAIRLTTFAEGRRSAAALAEAEAGSHRE